MRDDILITWSYYKKELILEAVNEMNAIEERIQVTYELEREGQKIPFLDIFEKTIVLPLMYIVNLHILKCISTRRLSFRHVTHDRTCPPL